MFKKSLLFVGLLISLVFRGKAQSYDEKLNAEFQKLSNLLFLLDRSYVDTVDMHEMVESAIVESLQKLDPHSVYIPKEELKKMNEPLEGNFEGVGIQFNILRDTLIVVNTIPGGPSEKIGIMAGDKILTIDTENVAGVELQNSGVVSRLRGDKGTKVTVEIKRGASADLLEFTITRDKIPLYSVDAGYMVTPETGYIKVNRFAANTVEEFHEKMALLKEQGMKNLVIDLQGNGGGYLKTAFNLADEFLSKDKLIVYTEGRSYPKESFNATEQGDWEKGKLVVLIDESSASASEIVSGAIQDWDRGLLVGRRTFGKGLVQKPFMLTDGSAVRLTISRYYTPSGRSIQKPYDGGHLEDYYKEKYDRYTSGELFNADSIQFPDSLKYQTFNKRTVYGGGGIMPDVFVPIDTTRSSEYFGKAIRKGLVNSYALTQAEKQRKKLLKLYPTVASFKQGFIVSDDDLIDMTNYFANEGGLAFEDKDYEGSKASIAIRYKALLARSIYGPEAFYVIINDINDPLTVALKYLENGEYKKMNLVD